MFDILSGVPKPVGVVIALAVVLALIGVIAWVVRRVAANRLGGGGMRGRQPRLAVIDAANVDARRKLILIRRDNIEHLLMIGGPSDIVVEPNIVRAGGARDSAREPSRLDLGARPAADNGWPLQPANEPPRARDEGWIEPVPARPRASDTPGVASPDLAARVAGPEVTPRRESRVPPATPSAPAEPVADHNLADMAQQLEAALRGSVAEQRSPSTQPAVQPVPPRPVPPAAAARPVEPPRRDIKMRIDPRIERGEPKRDVRPEPALDKPDLKPVPAPAAPAAEIKVEPKPDIRLAPEPKAETRVEPSFEARPEPKLDSGIAVKPEPKAEARPDALSRQDFYDNLEEEMASLLGRPSGKP